MVFFLQKTCFFLSKLKMINKTKKAPVQEFLFGWKKQQSFLCNSRNHLQRLDQCLLKGNELYICLQCLSLQLVVSHGKQQWAAACRGLRWSQWRKFAAYWDSAWQSARLGTVWQHRPQLPWWNVACGNQQEKKGWWPYFWNGSLPECWPNWRRQILQGALVQSNAFCD